MKVLICGVPPNKVSATEQALPDADLRVISCKEGAKAWRRKVIPTDLCIVITDLVAHENLVRVRMIFGRSYVAAQTYNEAMRIAANAVANERKSQ